MKNVNTLLKSVVLYNPKKEDIEKIKLAYDVASICHSDQVRQSGEPYIIHPLEVSIILANLCADTNTIVAALLHDVLEDTNISKEDLAYLFGDYVVKLVDGVTKINKANFSSIEEADAHNTRKLLQCVMSDVRVLYIKLADRLHNMRTLEYKSREKQKEIAKETVKLYIPLAAYLGCHDIQHELETLCFKYINPKSFCKYYKEEKMFYFNNQSIIDDTIKTIKDELKKHNINSKIYYRRKNIFQLYELDKNPNRREQIHDLFAIKINVASVEDCYRVLGFVHKHFKPYNSKFKDYIVQPKNNMYQSLHTTVFVGRQLFQFQIRTYKMDRVSRLGLTAYWQDHNVIMNDELSHFDFFKNLVKTNQNCKSNEEFINSAYKDVLTHVIYVYTPNGEIITLPVGSTPIDFAYQIHSSLGDHISAVLINGTFSKFDEKLKNFDVVTIITDKRQIPSEDWLEKCKTSKAKRKILKYLNNK